MSTVGLIWRAELLKLRRTQSALVVIVLVLMLSLVAAATSMHEAQQSRSLRERQQAAAQEAFESQPDRHPHRVVHYGHFVYRMPSPLTAFDPGVVPFTGNSMFLEGHRQNSANFGDVMQGSALIRFGLLTPAFVLQLLGPLGLVFIGFGALAGERERGTARLLIMQGATPRQLVAGKFLAMLTVAALFLLPGAIGLALAVGLAGGDGWTAALVLLAAYGLYLATWSALICAVSAFHSRGRDALMVLVGVWAVTTIMVPRLAPDLAMGLQPLPNRLQTDVGIAADLRQLGDSHDPDDPYFATFRRQVLERYGVASVDALPVNYKGLLAMEGERLTSGLFQDYAQRSAAIQRGQNDLVSAFGLVSPTIVLHGLSKRLAQTDLGSHLAFLDQAEAYRYGMVQHLNRLQVTDVAYADDTAKDADADRRKRIGSEHWTQIADFRHSARPDAGLLVSALPGLALVTAWFGAALLLLLSGAMRMGRTV